MVFDWCGMTVYHLIHYPWVSKQIFLRWLMRRNFLETFLLDLWYLINTITKIYIPTLLIYSFILNFCTQRLLSDLSNIYSIGWPIQYIKYIYRYFVKMFTVVFWLQVFITFQFFCTNNFNLRSCCGNMIGNMVILVSSATSDVTILTLAFSLFDSTILYVSFTLVLGATCVRVYLIDDVMIAEKVSVIWHNSLLQCIN